MSEAYPIQPLSREKRKVFSDLATVRGRRRRGLYVMEGRRAIADALSRGHRFPFIVVNDEGREWLESEATPLSGARVYQVPATEFRVLAQTSAPQGVLAIGRLPDLHLAALPADPPGLTLLVDGVRDPGNLGTLLRTLRGAGGTTALLPAGTVDPFNAKALRGSAGTVLDLAMAAGMTCREALDWCAERDLSTIALEAGGADLFDADLPPMPVALVVGNEATGISDEVRERATMIAGLPMDGRTESLSVAVAGSIGLYAVALGLMRRRGR